MGVNAREVASQAIKYGVPVGIAVGSTILSGGTAPAVIALAAGTALVTEVAVEKITEALTKGKDAAFDYAEAHHVHGIRPSSTPGHGGEGYRAAVRASQQNQSQGNVVHAH